MFSRSKFSSFFRFPIYGDADTRRQWLAGILQLFLFILAFLAFVDSILYFWPFADAEGIFHTFYVGSMALVLGVLLGLNRFPLVSRIGRPATILLLAIGILFSDAPESVVWGASFVLFALPVISASFILSPSASFWLALFITVELEIFSAVYVPGRETYPIYNAISLLAIAGVAWLAAASMERVLSHLEVLVAERTDHLNKTVARLTEATGTITAYSHELELTGTRLEQANMFKNLFLTSFRDELEAPLTGILQASAVGQGELSTGILRDPELARIHRNGRFLQALINYILDLGELEMGVLRVNRESVNIIPLIRSTVKLLGEQIAIKSQRIVLDIPSESVYAYVDRARIEQVLVNLLSAANKFSPDRTEISVSLSQCGGDCIQLSVRDSGPGISAENVNRMFEPYKRLGVSRRIIEMHDGKLWLDADPGKGASFVVELPASLPADVTSS